MALSLFASALALFAPAARAYTFSSLVGDGCHESITLDALEDVIDRTGWPAGEKPPFEESDRRALNDLAFSSRRVNDALAVAALLGVRHVDLQGHDPDDFIALAHEAALPRKQREHCLRGPKQDFVAGNLEAVADCRAFILEQLSLAIGDGAQIDYTARDQLRVWLAIRGPDDVRLNRVGVHLGLALHALQDSFTHHFRSADGRRIHHVTNYVDYVEGVHNEARDGHRHLSELDECAGSDGARTRRTHALAASTALVESLFAHADSRAERLRSVEAVLDEWLTLDRARADACSKENDYCDAPELSEARAGCSLSHGGASEHVLWLSVLCLGSFCLRRRRSLRGAAPLLLAAFVGAGSARAAAQDAGASLPPVTLAQTSTEATARKQDREWASGFGLYTSISGAVDEEAASVSLGGRADVTKWLRLGLDAEYNPWFSLSAKVASLGTFNVAAAAVIHYGTFGPAELMHTVHVGIGIMLDDLVGVKQHAVGGFFGFAPLGVGLHLDRHFTLVLEPGGLYVSVPQTDGIPFIRRQHRLLTIGLAWTL